MSISAGDLNRDFVVADDWVTGRQALEAAQGAAYLIIRFAGDQYVVVKPSDLSFKLKSWKIEDVPLGEVPDDLFERIFAHKIVDTVQQDLKDPADQSRVDNLKDGDLLVVLAGNEVLGILIERTERSAKPLAAPAPEAEAVSFGKKGAPGVLGPEDPEEDEAELPPGEAEPQKRYINAEIEDHEPEQPLHMDEVYTLAFGVDIQRSTSAVGTAILDDAALFPAHEQQVELTIQLSSEDFEIDPPSRNLQVPRTGVSKRKARFDIEPRHEGDGVINAVFLKEGIFIQVLTLKLHTGAPGQPGLLSGETLGRSVEAAFVVPPRDLNLTILKSTAGFQVIMSGAVAAMASLPITAPQLDHIIAQARQELKDIVHLEVGSQKLKVYQTGVDISPQVNQAALQRLARAGFRLYQQIFNGPAADAQTRLLGQRLREMAQKERLKIQIFSQEFVLPWGILYMADRYDPDQVNPELFLGLKHIIEHIPLQPDMQVMAREVKSDPQLTVSLNVNTDIDQQMGVPFIANQVSDWERISQRSGAQLTVRETREDVTKALADASNPDGILYFYCHAVSKSLAEGGGPEASALVMSNKGQLTLGDLYLDAPRDVIFPGAPLVFINACESAELSPLFYDGFVPYFMAKGARGVIGTECETPALFAAEWAKRFFKHFLTGKPLGESFLELRREFYYQNNNLMGLLYALYCDGDTQVVPGLQVE